MVRDRADRSSCANHQICRSDTVRKKFLALFGTIVAPWGNFFGPFGRPLTVIDFHKSVLCRYLSCFTVKMAFKPVSDKSRVEKNQKNAKKPMKDIFFGKVSARKSS